MYFDLQDYVFADSEHGYHVGYGLSIIPFVLRTSLLNPIVQENLRSKVIPVKLKLCPFNHISTLPFSSFPDPPAWLYFLHKINFPLVVCLPTNKSDCLWITHCALQVLMIFLIDVSQVIGGGGGMCPQCPHGSYTSDTHMHVHPHTCQRPSALHGPGLLAISPPTPLHDYPLLSLCD